MDERAKDLLVLAYLIYIIAIYVYDKFKAAYFFILDFFSQNSDILFWLIIVMAASCFWYLCGWLGRKKMKKLGNTKYEPTSKPEAKSEPISDLEKNY
ncbi:MAG: hypothetical protein LLG05_08120, partial [Porphyromonadaceae bacterium]|nr:hypothetical protein [Porphyromonadaceae bacterium]